MRIESILIGCLVFVVSGAFADSTSKHYKVVGEDGTIFYGDSVPPEYTDYEKEVVNDHAVTIRRIEGRKTEEELAAERAAEKILVQEQLQLRADKALLATYLSVDEILMHRDRRIELFQAQSRVTQLYLRNLKRRLEKLEREASRYAPYSSDEDAEIIDPDLVNDINDTKSTIERHERNLDKFKSDEEVIVARFAGDINRFKSLKGLE